MNAPDRLRLCDMRRTECETEHESNDKQQLRHLPHNVEFWRDHFVLLLGAVHLTPDSRNLAGNRDGIWADYWGVGGEVLSGGPKFPRSGPDGTPEFAHHGPGCRRKPCGGAGGVAEFEDAGG